MADNGDANVLKDCDYTSTDGTTGRGVGPLSQEEFYLILSLAAAIGLDPSNSRLDDGFFFA